MKNPQVILNRTMLTDLEGIASLFLGCNNPAEDIAMAHSLLTNALLLNVAKLNLDEGIMNLMRFSVGMAVEISPFLSDMHAGFTSNHWEWKPVMVKINGKSQPWSEIRPPEKQAACMIAVMANQLKSDVNFLDGALAIEDYQLQSGIWSSSEFPDIYE